jgi:S-adenosylmethionine:tRNA ribosyltransferase-isomerase
LVFNDTAVLPARFMLQKPSGGQIEGLFLEEISPGRWRVLLKNVGRASPGVILRFTHAQHIEAQLAAKSQQGEYVLQVSSSEPATQLLARLGRMPLPPYIKRAKTHDQRDDLDCQRYQTIYAHHPGAVAAPTAGLHFTDDLFRQLQDAGIQHVFLTLHVGLGTFKPITATDLADHVMHEEKYCISPEAAAALNQAKKDHRRIIAVGTTSARVLESQTDDSPFTAKTDRTGIFIYPAYCWKHVDALISNFHLPRSTLIALVAAMMGLEEQRRAYKEAIVHRYRFFSYGDAMFIE